MYAFWERTIQLARFSICKCYIHSLAPLTHPRPMGVFEFDNFAAGSKAILDAVVMATERGATSIIGQSLSLSYLCHVTVM